MVERLPRRYTAADFLRVDSPASRVPTRELLGRQPAHPRLIADLEEGHYFRNGRS